VSREFTNLLVDMKTYLDAHKADWGGGFITINGTLDQLGLFGINLTGSYVPIDPGIDGVYKATVNLEIWDRRAWSIDNKGIDEAADDVIWLLSTWIGRGTHIKYQFADAIPSAGTTQTVTVGETAWLKKTIQAWIQFSRNQFPS
jgi:hypothetical protein